MGLNRSRRARSSLNGRDMTGARTDAVHRGGVHYLPPDRKNEGLVLAASASDNIALGMLGRADMAVAWGRRAASREGDRRHNRRARRP